MKPKKISPSPLVISPTSEPPPEEVEQPESEDDIRENWWESISPGKLLLASAVAFGIFVVLRSMSTATPWPTRSQIHPAVGSDIVRTPSTSPKFNLKTVTKDWEISPLEMWDHSLLVTSASPPSKWTDVSVKGRDEIVILDITGVWGENATGGKYERVDFGNTGGSGYAVGAPSSWSPDNFAYLSLISASPSIQSAIRRLRPGDQCRIVGTRVDCYLKEKNGTLLPLYPSDEGAYPPIAIEVEELIFLRKHNYGWRTASQIAMGIAVSLFALAAAAQMLPDRE